MMHTSCQIIVLVAVATVGLSAGADLSLPVSPNYPNGVVQQHKEVFFSNAKPVPKSGYPTGNPLYVQRTPFMLGLQTSKNSPQTLNVTKFDVNKLLNGNTLDLSGLGLTGDQVKDALNNLNGSFRYNLQILILSRNQIHSLPVSTFPFELQYALKELYLEDNPLGRLDAYTQFELFRLTNLKTLSLARTGLSSSDSLLIPSLESLDLSGNSLFIERAFRQGSTSGCKVLDGFVNLQKLNLSNNSLQYPTLCSLKQIRELDLSNNRISSIGGFFGREETRSLQKVSLANNKLNYYWDVEQLPRNVLVTLAGNPWSCSCRLLDFINDKTREVIDKDALRCTDDVRTVPWLVLSLNRRDLNDCPPEGFKLLQMKIQERYEDVCRFFRRYLSFLFPVFTFLWYVFVLCSAMLLMRVVYPVLHCVLEKVKSRYGKKFPKLTIPYNILDDKNSSEASSVCVK